MIFVRVLKTSINYLRVLLNPIAIYKLNHIVESRIEIKAFGYSIQSLDISTTFEKTN